jgi:hypothetical protein
VKFNAGGRTGNKDDTFPTADAARIGGWPVGYGVGFRGNNWRTCNFQPEFFGLGSAEGRTLSFVSELAASTGGGDYRPASGSDVRLAIPAGGAVVPYDLDGTAFDNTGFGSAGAYQYVADVPTGTSFPVIGNGGLVYSGSGGGLVY